MKAAYTTNNLFCRITYGDRAAPKIGASQVLVRVHCVGVNPLDWKFPPMIGGFYPFPIVPGHDFLGRIERVGRRVRDLDSGQYVFGTKLWSRYGTCAEYVAVDAKVVAPKPDRMSLEEAGAAPLAALTALQGLKQAGLRSGQRVLVIGAAGGVGHCAVQLARARGAIVTGVCGSANVDFVKKLGAVAVVDYEKEEFTRLIRGVDIVFDTVGKYDLQKLRQVLAPQGIYLTTMPNARSLVDIAHTQLIKASGRSAQRAFLISVRASRHDLQEIGVLAESGQFRVRLGRRFTLPQTAEAYALGRKSHARGKNLIVVDPSV